MEGSFDLLHLGTLLQELGCYRPGRDSNQSFFTEQSVSYPIALRRRFGLFADNPFWNAPPHFVRAVLWQYWFSTPEQKHTEGVWWRRQFLGAYAPTLTRLPDSHFEVITD